MVTKEELSRFNEIINMSKEVIIVTHQFPDLDAIGSSLALYHQLLKKVIKTTLYSPNKIDKQFHFLPGAKNFKTKLRTENPDVIIAIDSATRERIDGYKKLDQYIDIPIINIDHHHDNSRYGDFNIVKDISSVGELLTHLFNSLND